MADEVRDAADDLPGPERGAGPPPPDPPSVGWAADPFGRFAARYWDGTRWTEQVLDQDGHLAADPAPLNDPSAWSRRQDAGAADAASSQAPPPGSSAPPPQYSPPPYPPPDGDYERSAPPRRRQSLLRRRDGCLLVVLGLIALLIIGGSIKFYVIKDDNEPSASRARSFAALALVLRPGDCVNSSEGLHAVSCTQPHAGEVFFVADYPADAPDPVTHGDLNEVGRAWTSQNCVPSFATYVGVPLEQSQYRILSVLPDPEIRATGVQRALCLVVAGTDGSPLTHPVKGTAE